MNCFHGIIHTDSFLFLFLFKGFSIIKREGRAVLATTREILINFHSRFTSTLSSGFLLLFLFRRDTLFKLRTGASLLIIMQSVVVDSISS